MEGRGGEEEQLGDEINSKITIFHLRARPAGDKWSQHSESCLPSHSRPSSLSLLFSVPFAHLTPLSLSLPSFLPSAL